MGRKLIDRTGETNYNSYGEKMEIIKYINAHDITIKFENNSTTKTAYKHFINGCATSKLTRTIYNIGYLGEGEHKAIINDKPTYKYNTWKSMLQRCYSDKYKNKKTTYKNVICCEEWHNFQNFAKWFDENYYEINGEITQLDKDILNKENKIYSPSNCIFVPIRINELFIKNDINRGKYPVGVHYDKSTNKYVASCSYKKKNISKKRKTIGRYETPEEAFYKGYKPFKENYIKEVAKEYKDKIPKKLYEAMCNWIVEIDD